jgi:enoyl-CoA hydratase/carnithine racemase
LILTGRVIGAEEAARIGLVHEVVADGEARHRADQIAAEIADRGPLAVREAKRLIDVALDTELDVGLAAELEASVRIFETEDMLEGARAFFAKRDPDYHGR